VTILKSNNGNDTDSDNNNTKSNTHIYLQALSNPHLLIVFSVLVKLIIWKPDRCYLH